MQLTAGETVIVLLPGFSGAPFTDYKVRSQSNVVPGPCFLVAISFEGESCKVEMRVDQVDRSDGACPSNIAAGTSFHVVIPSSQGIIVPGHGVTTAELGYIISSDALAGPVLPTIIEKFPALGHFHQTSLKMTATPTGSNSRGLGQADTAAEFVFTFISETVIGQDSTVNFTLPDFGGNSFTALPIDANSSQSVGSGNLTRLLIASSSFLASWSSESKTLSFLVTRGGIPPKYLMTMTVLATAGIALPVRGVRQNQTNITIQTDAVEGPVQPTSVMSVQGVGVFMDSRLNFSAAKANKSSTIAVSVSPAMSMSVGDKIIVDLPGFEGDNFTRAVRSTNYTHILEYMIGNETYMSTTSYTRGFFATMMWDNNASQLSIIFDSTAPADINLRFECDAAFGIRLPVLGVRTNQAALRISSNAIAGQVPRTSVNTTQPVGHFATSTLTFNHPAVYGKSNNFSFSFSTSMEMIANETLILELNGFHGGDYRWYCFGTDQEGLLSTSPYCAVRVAVWNSSASTLTLTLGRNLNIGSPVAIGFVSSNAGLKIPIIGVRENQANLFLSTGAGLGPVVRTPGTAIISTQPVGGFLKDSTILEFVPQKANVAGDIVLKAAIYMPLLAGDSFNVLLPTFIGEATGINDTLRFESSPNATQRVAWNPRSQELSVFISSRMEPGTFNITVFDSGIQIPAVGIRVDRSNITIAVNARVGPVLSEPFAYVPMIGSFTDTTRLAFKLLAKANENTYIDFSFVPKMTLQASDIVTLNLPGFQSSRGGSVFSENITVNWIDSVTQCPNVTIDCGNATVSKFF